MEIARSWPERTMMIEFDALCVMPDLHCAKIAKILGAELRDEVLADFRKFIRQLEPSASAAPSSRNTIQSI
jgi:hypothetical protein